MTKKAVFNIVPGFIDINYKRFHLVDEDYLKFLLREAKDSQERCSQQNFLFAWQAQFQCNVSEIERLTTAIEEEEIPQFQQ